MFVIKPWSVFEGEDLEGIGRKISWSFWGDSYGTKSSSNFMLSSYLTKWANAAFVNNAQVSFDYKAHSFKLCFSNLW